MDSRVEDEFIVRFGHLNESLQENRALNLVLEGVRLLRSVVMLTCIVFCCCRPLALSVESGFIVLETDQHGRLGNVS